MYYECTYTSVPHVTRTAKKKESERASEEGRLEGGELERARPPAARALLLPLTASASLASQRDQIKTSVARLGACPIRGNKTTALIGWKNQHFYIYTVGLRAMEADSLSGPMVTFSNYVQSSRPAFTRAIVMPTFRYAYTRLESTTLRTLESERCCRCRCRPRPAYELSNRPTDRLCSPLAAGLDSPSLAISAVAAASVALSSVRSSVRPSPTSRCC